MMRFCWLVILICSTAIGAETSGDKALTEVRSLAAGRDVAGAKAALKKAETHKGDAKFDAEWNRLDELLNYVEQFWRMVERGAASLDAVEELEVGDQRVAVVEASGAKIVLRVAGQNKTYTPQNIPPKLAITFAERVMKKNEPVNQVIIGAFLALDGKGDRDKAREYWMTASKAGLDVKPLLPELGAPRVAPPVEIPTLTPPQRAFLDPKQWTLRVKGDKGWVRKPLDDAKQNDEGRLVVAASGGDAQILFKRPLNGDFVCRVIVKDARDGARVGLVGTTLEDVGYYVDLPEGTSYLQFARKGNAITAKVGENAVELKTVGKATERMAGALAISLPADGELIVAAIDFAAK